MQDRDEVGQAPGAGEGSWAGAAACQGGPGMGALGRTPAHISPGWHCAPLERLWTKWHQIHVVPWLCAMKNLPVQYLSINKEP